MSAKEILQGVSRRRLTNNTQKAAFRLLSAEGAWVSRTELARTITSASARVRDLRKEQFGAFQVECASASDLNKRGSRNSFFYRIQPKTVKKNSVAKVFRI